MARRFTSPYNGLLCATVLLAALGCGKPAPPPQGATQNTTAPTVDLGTESSPKETGAGAPDSSPESGSTPAEKGDQK